MRYFVITVFTLMLAGAVHAQDFNSARTVDLSQRLASGNSFADNVDLRFLVLAREIGNIEGESDLRNLLNFFSDTRVMVWNNEVSPQSEQLMIELEQQMQALAATEGILLDLPPVGYSPRGENRLLAVENLTADGMSALVLQTERLATEMLNEQSSQELRELRDSLTQLRSDLDDATLTPSNVRAVLAARSRFLSRAPAEQVSQARLLPSLNRLVSGVRGTFSVTALTGPADEELTLVGE